MTNQTICRGDWVRWQDGDDLIIGVVQYVNEREDKRMTEIITDIGSFWQTAVLEVRRVELT